MWLRCLSLGLETAERKGFHTFRIRFVGECMALFVAETPRKPTVEQVGASTDITVRRNLKAAVLSLRQWNRPDRMEGRIVDADRTRPRIDRVIDGRGDGPVNLGILRLLRYQAELGCHSAELWKRTGVHLPHRVAAVDLHRGFADTNIAGNLLAKTTPRDLHHDFTLSGA